MNTALSIIIILSLNAYNDCDGRRSKLTKTPRQLNKLTIETTTGKLFGKFDETEDGTKYAGYVGIPFAKPPVGELRFEPPQPFKWEGTWNATYERDWCVQSLEIGNEDCLYLNIIVPISKAKKPRSVLVSVYGGGFISGTSSTNVYNPSLFLQQDLIFASFNYRIGVFGFISSGDKVAPGNAGLKDQIMALKWIKENIRLFGGDPDDVTIMGQSAGGVCVSHLIQSPAAEGLFNKAIIESASSITPWATSRNFKQNFKLLGAYNSVTSGDSEEIIKKLKTIDATTLLINSFVSLLRSLPDAVVNTFDYAPVIEVNNPTAVITADSYDVLNKCKFRAVPILIGFNSEEVTFFENAIHLLKIFIFKYDVDPSLLVPKGAHTKCKPDYIGESIIKYYAGNELFAVGDSFVRFGTDYYFIYPILKYVQLYTKCDRDVFYYRFSYDESGRNRTGHSAELKYLFPLKLFGTVKNVDLSHKMVKLWSDFVKFGNPTPSKSTLNETWTQSSEKNDYSYLNIGDNIAMVRQSDSPHKQNLDFWIDLDKRC